MPTKVYAWSTVALWVALSPSGAALAQGVGYEEDIKSIISSKCASCHNTQAPTLKSYAEVKGQASASMAAMQAGRMPKGQAKLDDASLKKFADWQAAGMPEKRAASPAPGPGPTPGPSVLPSPGPRPPSTPAPLPSPGPRPPTGPSPQPPRPPGGNNNGNNTPIILDLAGHGDFKFLPDPVRFDLHGDGKPMKLRWPGGNVGFLTVDLNGNGIVDNGTELFGDATALVDQPGQRAKDGFVALAQFDKNGDGLIDTRDPIFAKLRLWNDANQNGVSESGEVDPIAVYDIVALGLKHERIDGPAGTPALLLGSYYTEDMERGREIRIMADIFLETY